MKSGLGLGVAIAILFLGAQAAVAAGGDAKAGKVTYEKTCGKCHAADGAAKEAIAKLLKVEMPHLGSAEVQAKTDDEIRKVIVEGYEKMKPVKDLNDNDVANVVAFVRTLKK
jgi:mono/diheme cytochrome c family protein